MLICGMQNGEEPFCAWAQGGWSEKPRRRECRPGRMLPKTAEGREKQLGPLFLEDYFCLLGALLLFAVGAGDIPERNWLGNRAKFP